MSVPPSLCHHHPKQEREEVEAIVSRHSLQFRSQGGDVGGCFHGGSYGRAEDGGGIAMISTRPAHTRRRKPRDLIIVTGAQRQTFSLNCARRGDEPPASARAPLTSGAGGMQDRCVSVPPQIRGGPALPDRNLGRHPVGPFYSDHGGVPPVVTASARANSSPRFARARQLFRRKPGVVSGIRAGDVRWQVESMPLGLCTPYRRDTQARPHYRLFQPADKPLEILVKPAPRLAHTTAPIPTRRSSRLPGLNRCVCVSPISKGPRCVCPTKHGEGISRDVGHSHRDQRKPERAFNERCC